MPYMGELKQSTQVTKTILMVDSTDHVTGKTGLTITKYLTKAGGTPTSATMTTSELDSTNAKGIYSLVFTTTHTDTLGDFQLHLTATGADPVDLWWTFSARVNDDFAYPATSGRSMVVDANGLVDANMVKVGPTGSGTAQTAGDIPARLPSALTANGNMKSSLVEILTTALTETAGLLAGGFKKFFNVSTPTGTLNSIPDAVAGAASGLALVGSNMGTVTTATNLTNNQAKYMHGAVWIGPVANTNTTSYVDGITTNPVSTIAAAKTIADALGLRKFYTIRTGASQIGADMVGYDFDGTAWSLTTTGGSRDVSSSSFKNAYVIGGTYASTSAASWWENCEFADGITVAAANMARCTFGGTLTLSAAGNYNFVDCASIVAGTGTPVFAVPSGTVNISFRRWSGGISITGITSGTTISIDMVSGGTVTLAGADGNVQIRGMTAGITDNRTGSPTLGQNAAINMSKINTEADTALTDYGALKPTVAGRTLDVTATGAAGIDWGNVENQSATVDLTTTLIAQCVSAGFEAYPATKVYFADEETLQDKLPRMETTLNAVPNAAAINAEVVDALTVDTIADSYAADGAQPTIAQAILAIQQFLFDKGVSSTTVTVKKPDNTTTAMTFTLDSATSPTTITRAS